MKALYPLVLLAITGLFFPLSVYSQYAPEPWFPGSEAITKSEGVEIIEKELLWYEDFENGLPDTWQNINANGFCAFSYTKQGPRGPFSIGMPALASQTGSNGFMILDSDLCSSVNPQGLTTDAWLQSPSIDIPASSSIMLSFQHNFRYCCSSDQSLILAEVSTDGESWTSFNVKNGIAPNNTSSNPVYQSIDISSVTRGYSKVWVRFRQSGVSHYWWMIDDIKLVSFVDNDLEIVEAAGNGGYASIPAGQHFPINMGGKVANSGGLTQNGLVFSTSVNEYLFNSAINHPSLGAGQVTTFNEPRAFMAPGRGVYNIKYSITQDQVDLIPENNSLSFTFQVTDTVFSRTGNISSVSQFVASQADAIFAVGNRYTIIDEIALTSISAFFAPGTDTGAAVTGKIYTVKDNVFTLVASSEEYELTSVDISSEGNVVPVIFTFNEKPLLLPGEYVAVVEAPVQAENIQVVAMHADYQPHDASFRYLEGHWQTLATIPVIDMNFGGNKAECEPHYYFSTTAATCGTTSGSIEAIPLNGAGPYVYEWTEFPENTTSVLEGLAEGEYEVTITDAFNCKFNSLVSIDSKEISVEYSVTEAVCNTEGAVLLNPIDGAAPYQYSWLHDESLSEPLAADLEAGTYLATVTDNNGCITQVEVVVENIAELSVGILTTDAFCNHPNGTITLEPMAGVGPYIYSWAELPGNSQSFAEQLVPGEYSFVVKDANDCSFSGKAMVNSQSYQLEAIATATDATCGLPNGSISLEIQNGMAPYIYDWPGGIGSEKIENLAPGEYHVDYFDKNGCPGSQVISIINNGTMPEVTTQADDSPGCGQQGGSFTISPAGDQLYTYTLADESGEPKNYVIEKSTGFSLQNLAAGHYLVKVLNQDGCENIVAVNISDTGAPSVTASENPVTCFGLSNGSLEVTVEGGVAPAYQWEHDEPNTTSVATALKAGTYTVKVTDGTCVAVKSFDVTEPKQLLGTATIEHIVCANEKATGNIFLTTSGGTAPFSYIWSTGVSNKNLLDIAGGIYHVKITDFNDCTFAKHFTVEANDPLVASAEVVHVDGDAGNGQITLTVEGGQGDYSFNWSNGAESWVVSGLTAGDYSVTITDEAGCQLAQSFLVGYTAVTPEVANTFVIYPNPAQSILNVDAGQWHSLDGNGYELEIFNIIGEKVVSTTIGSYTYKTVVDIEHLYKGIYIIRLSSGRQSLQARFVKN